MTRPFSNSLFLCGKVLILWKKFAEKSILRYIIGGKIFGIQTLPVSSPRPVIFKLFLKHISYHQPPNFGIYYPHILVAGNLPSPSLSCKILSYSSGLQRGRTTYTNGYGKKILWFLYVFISRTFFEDVHF